MSFSIARPTNDCYTSRISCLSYGGEHSNTETIRTIINRFRSRLVPYRYSILIESSSDCCSINDVLRKDDTKLRQLYRNNKSLEQSYTSCETSSTLSEYEDVSSCVNSCTTSTKETSLINTLSFDDVNSELDNEADVQLLPTTNFRLQVHSSVNIPCTFSNTDEQSIHRPIPRINPSRLDYSIGHRAVTYLRHYHLLQEELEEIRSAVNFGRNISIHYDDDIDLSFFETDPKDAVNYDSLETTCNTIEKCDAEYGSGEQAILDSKSPDRSERVEIIEEIIVGLDDTCTAIRNIECLEEVSNDTCYITLDAGTTSFVGDEPENDISDQNEVMKHTNKACHIIDLDEACQIADLDEACQIVDLDEACRIGDLDEACQIGDLDEACQTVDLDEAYQIVDLDDISLILDEELPLSTISSASSSFQKVVKWADENEGKPLIDVYEYNVQQDETCRAFIVLVNEPIEANEFLYCEFNTQQPLKIHDLLSQLPNLRMKRKEEQSQPQHSAVSLNEHKKRDSDTNQTTDADCSSNNQQEPTSRIDEAISNIQYVSLSILGKELISMLTIQDYFCVGDNESKYILRDGIIFFAQRDIGERDKEMYSKRVQQLFSNNNLRRAMLRTRIAGRALQQLKSSTELQLERSASFRHLQKCIDPNYLNEPDKTDDTVNQAELAIDEEDLDNTETHIQNIPTSVSHPVSVSSNYIVKPCLPFYTAPRTDIERIFCEKPTFSNDEHESVSMSVISVTCDSSMDLVRITF